ncbi:hypothetical protein [Heyndrickxia coagulans]|uniref:hypothetical protein n=1 Tax=Heyndrickxia coagulans TaxID=1398 RepID=UPI000A5EFAF4|nr:hypothetical protein [Heyndrickxia coagulans]
MNLGKWQFYNGMQLPCLLEGLRSLVSARRLAALPGLLFARESWFIGKPETDLFINNVDLNGGDSTKACSCPACLRGCCAWIWQGNWPLCPDSSLHAKAGSWQARNGFVHQQCGIMKMEWQGSLARHFYMKAFTI